MKPILILLFTFISSSLIAQNYSFGLFANSYLEPAKYGVDKMIPIQKSISIIYNKEYCSFYVEGKGVTFFKTRSYETILHGDYMHTSFLSEETNVTPDGWYSIVIDENKDGIIFQVILPSHAGDRIYPNGFTYLVKNAKKYSEDGKVIGNVQIINQKKDYETNVNLIAEQKKYWDTVTNVNFEQNPTLKQKHLICKTNISEYISDKLNFHTSKTKVEPFYIVHVFFNVDTSGKISIQGRKLTERYPNTSIIEDLSGIDIDKKVKEIFMTIPWEFEKDFRGRQKEIYNCEVTVNLEAKPSGSH